METVKVTYFSDALCIWAYAAQARVDAVKAEFGEAVSIEHRFCSVFGDTNSKITTAWKGRGEYDGFSAHLCEVAQRFPHISVHPEIWRRTRPASSASVHLFLKAVEHTERNSGTIGKQDRKSVFEQVNAGLRSAFFRDCRDIARWEVQCEVAEPLGVDLAEIERSIRSGTVFARLAADYQDADKLRIEGSPTFLLNEGRQKLYGNVGFRMIEANIAELLRDHNHDEASWC